MTYRDASSASSRQTRWGGRHHSEHGLPRLREIALDIKDLAVRAMKHISGARRIEISNSVGQA